MTRHRPGLAVRPPEPEPEPEPNRTGMMIVGITFTAMIMVAGAAIGHIAAPYLTWIVVTLGVAAGVL